MAKGISEGDDFRFSRLIGDVDLRKLGDEESEVYSEVSQSQSSEKNYFTSFKAGAILAINGPFHVTKQAACEFLEGSRTQEDFLATLFGVLVLQSFNLD